jgi:hypothetical protein
MMKKIRSTLLTKEKKGNFEWKQHFFIGFTRACFHYLAWDSAASLKLKCRTHILQTLQGYI